MIVVKTFSAPDAFGGTGLFAAEAIPAGAVVWDFNPEIDVIYSWEEYHALPPPVQEENSPHIHPIYRDGEWGIVVNHDNDRFWNHSFAPNTGTSDDQRGAALTEIANLRAVALRDIEKGEEITINYHDFVPPPGVLPARFEALPLVRFLRNVSASAQSAAE